MTNIIFFDIDGTLFDVSCFISLLNNELVNQFGLTNQDIQSLRILYDEVKKEEGYFLPSSFLNKIIHNFSSINKQELEKVFNNVDLFEKSVYKDTSAIKTLSDSAIIGIFSQGDKDFQKKKIGFINNLLNDKNIYIFPNKLKEARQVFDKYGTYKITLIDDNPDILMNIKNIFPNISVVLIDRTERFSDNKDIIKIKDLNELKPLL